jgi:hypothetical protein
MATGIPLYFLPWALEVIPPAGNLDQCRMPSVSVHATFRKGKLNLTLGFLHISRTMQIREAAQAQESGRRRRELGQHMHFGRGCIAHCVQRRRPKNGGVYREQQTHPGCKHVPRIGRPGARLVLPESLLSFINGSGRLTNKRLKRELKVKLK